MNRKQQAFTGDLIKMVIIEKRPLTVNDWTCFFRNLVYFFIKEIKSVLKWDFKMSGIKDRFPRPGHLTPEQVSQITKYLAKKYGIEL